MKNRMKRLIVLLLGAALLAGGAAGCELFVKSYNYSTAKDSVFVKADGTIRAAMISDFDKDYYSIEELAGVAQQEVLSYNTTLYGCSFYSYSQMTKEEKQTILLPVSFEDAYVKDGKATVEFSYANGDTYSSFNKVELEQKGGKKLYTAGLSYTTMPLTGSFVSADGSKTITGEELMTKQGYCMVYADHPVTVYTEHDIAYISPNVGVLTSNCAQIKGTDGGYIIFK